MEKFKGLSAAVLLLCSAVLWAGGTSEAGIETAAWKIGVVTPPGHPHTLGAEHLAALIEEKTGGRVTVRVHHSGELGTNPELLDSVKQGVIEMCVNTPGVLAEYNTVTGLLELPYLFTSLEHREAVVEGPVGETIADIYLEATGLRILGYFGGAQRNMISSTKLGGIDDLKGMKMRTWEWDIMINWWKNLGANPAVVSFPEVYTALQTGVVDGAENEFTTFDVSKWAEVAKFITLTQHNLTVRPLVINEKKLRNLAPDLQDLVLQAASESVAYAVELEIGMDSEKMQLMTSDYGAELTEVDKEPFIDRSIPIILEFAKENDLEDIAQEIISMGK